MYVVLVYDVSTKRVSKIMKICRKYLVHIQNSVFEGQISSANLKKLKIEIKNNIKKEDSVIVFEFSSFNKKFASKKIIGKEKRSTRNIF
jgi:CRISPR-associated protein Cas2